MSDNLFTTLLKRMGLAQQPQDIHLESQYDTPEGQHPKGVPESGAEQAIKVMANRAGGFEPDNDMPYLEQYLHPDYNVIPKQTLRPTKGTPNGLVYRHINKQVQPETTFEDWVKASNKAEEGRTNHLDFRGMERFPVSVPNVRGLGGHKYDYSHPDYNSVFDTWDFNTNSELVGGRLAEVLGLDALAKAVLRRVGTPFNVYERFPKDPPATGFLHDPVKK